MLCETCQSVLDEINPLFPFLKERDRWIDELINSAQESCHMCHQIWTCLLRARPDLAVAVQAFLYCSKNLKATEFARPVRGIPNRLISLKHKVLKISRPYVTIEYDRGDISDAPEVTSPNTKDRYGTVRTKIWAQPDREGKFSMSSKSKAFTEDTGCCFVVAHKRDFAQPSSKIRLIEDMATDLCLRRARLWMKDCHKNHSICEVIRRRSPPSSAPTRLIELDQPSSNHVRLIEQIGVSKISGSPQYVTLSHCWGTSQFYKLTASTFIELTEGIEKTRLPQTFQDAINVAKALRIKLIWIDSLCIFQDSAEDWFHEAPLMSEIYGGSICNIAASSSVDSSAGALAVRDISLELVRPCVFPAAWSNHEPHVLYPKSFWQDSLHHTPLIQRAWVVQEVLLAPRIVYLHERQLFWECYQMRACEGFPGGIPIDSDAQTTERVLLSGIKAPVLEEFGRQIFTFERSIIPDRNFIIEMARNFWIKTIRHYNSCQLTNQKDKLIALSGVTKPLEILLDDICPAGLWAKQFVPQLLWKISLATGPIIRLTESSVPSWSWASFTGDMEPGHFRCDRSLVDILAIASASASTAAALNNSGPVRIRGPLFTVECCTCKPGEYQLRDAKTCWLKPEYGESVLVDCYTDVKGHRRIMHCLPLLVNVDPSGWKVEGLLLHPVKGKRGKFLRRGYFKKNYPNLVDRRTWREFDSVCPVKYLKFDGDALYTISIV